jgi:hypothetical protein
MNDDDDKDVLVTGVVIAAIIACFATTPYLVALMK